MSLDAIRESLKEKLSPDRYAHSIGVMQTAQRLALRYGADAQRAALAGLIHDCARFLCLEDQLKKADALGILLDEIQRHEKVLLHGPLGAIVARELYGVCDEEILRAVEIHTTGDADMTVLEKIIYVADYIEPNRNFFGVQDIRTLAMISLDSAMVLAYDTTINYVISRGRLLHPRTIAGRNYILLQGESKS